MLFHFLVLPTLLLAFTEATNETGVVKYHPKQSGAPVCQDNEFECYLFLGACKAVSTKKLMHEACQYTCALCKDAKTKFAFPKKYTQFFGSTQFKYYSNNYYSGYNGYCCGQVELIRLCYGGGFVGFAGYPGFSSFGIGGFDLFLAPIEGFLLGLGQSIGLGLANLGGLLGRGVQNYGYGFGNSYLCVDYLPACYQYVPYCYSPLSYYYSCMARYCPLTCGFCVGGSIGGPGLIAGYNPATYPGYTQNTGGYYYPQQQQQSPYYYYPQQQQSPYQYGNQNGYGYQYGNQGYQNGYGYQYKR